MKKYFFLIFFIIIFPISAFSQSFDDLLIKFDNQYESASYDNAKKTAEELLTIAEDKFGTKSYQYSAALEKKAEITLMLGDLSNAFNQYSNALQTLENISKSNSPLYAKILTGLALCYDYKDDFYNSESYYKKALNVYRSASGSSSFDYIKTLESIGGLYWSFNLYPKANSTYKEIYDLVMKMYSEGKLNREDSPYSIMVLNYATLLKEQNLHEKVIEILKDALKLTEAAKGIDHPDTRMIIDEIISENILNGMKTDIDGIVSRSISMWSKELTEDFEYEPEESKMLTLQYMTQDADVFYSYGLKRKEVNKNILNDIFNFRIATKGVVLKSTSGIRKRIERSGDENVIRLYGELKELKQRLTEGYSMTGSERAEKKINMDSISKASKTLELYIGNFLKEDSREQVSGSKGWEEIKKDLKQGETAIDFINFVNIREKFYDSSYTSADTVYCAFVISPDSEIPEMISLTSAKELNKILLNGNDTYINDPSASSEIYSLVISPLESFLSGTKKIYISPSGVLNSISFASLKNIAGEYLIDRFDIEYCNNLSEISFINTDKGSIDYKDAVLFGGIQYDIDSAAYVNTSTKTHKLSASEETNNSLDSALTSLSNNRSFKAGGWNFLLGTLTETQSVSDVLKENNTSVKLFSGTDATEEAFKSLSGNNSPSLLHISTHGFFFPDLYGNLNSLDKQEAAKKQTSFKGVFRKSINPLMRSGLIFAGANLYWRDGKKIKGTEDGILTAFEVTGMDLINTRLVVLSACETGLGDIANGEGVIGLQRAFKIAGVKNIIMSLWKVPDKETSELMQTFYKYFFHDKLPLRESFLNAQKDMRKKYNEPYYWSAFILI